MCSGSEIFLEEVTRLRKVLKLSEDRKGGFREEELVLLNLFSRIFGSFGSSDSRPGWKFSPTCIRALTYMPPSLTYLQPRALKKGNNIIFARSRLRRGDNVIGLRRHKIRGIVCLGEHYIWRLHAREHGKANCEVRRTVSKEGRRDGKQKESSINILVALTTTED